MKNEFEVKEHNHVGQGVVFAYGTIGSTSAIRCSRIALDRTVVSKTMVFGTEVEARSTYEELVSVFTEAIAAGVHPSEMLDF